jgi:iron complex transport system substrate-binding protein
MFKKFSLLSIFILELFSYDKIIALSPSINEIIYALGSGDTIVGNTDFCNYPKDAQTKTKVGGYFSPNLEKIVALKPDLVIMLESSQKLTLKLHKLGIETKVLKLTTLEDIKQSIKTIGNIIRKPNEANQLLQTIEQKLQNIQNIVQNQKILMVIGHNLSLKKRIFVVGQNLYLDDIITISGNKNGFFSTRKGQPILNMENIIATNSDIVILLSPYRVKKNLTKEQLLEPWYKLPIGAAKDKKIYIIDKEYAGISSDRIVYFLDDFRDILLDAKNR